ncbi:ribosome maturation factor RimP [Thermanaerosceptrum fracticalcis]|uniref:Ribosome maturation factor RimP n=1 Tax=Thermanaerosceptrum fracticalcis TaxID=1712410 RepID=A0A7G6E0X3_THEFR|nr:ribosome maturation factor RimP [Thermanaerosceptrum fracticalcis]QNB45727.1 ribosome maturation factor RimP [Thermanaerosceptrum fracticalcis]
MQGKKTQDVVYELVKPLIEDKGMELVDVEFVKEGPNWYLRIYIDKENGVDLDDCQEISGIISDLLDEADPIPQSYFLEVSSPGIERPLKKEKDFIKYKNHAVNVSTFVPIEGKKVLQGKLGNVTSEVLAVILPNGQEIQVPRDKISQVRLAWED